MSSQGSYVQRNHVLWDSRAEPHFRSAFYDVESFREGGKLSLTHIELQALGDVRGQSLLHLQCHFGQDTLSWARLGAAVTGVDFSERAIRLARRLAEEMKLPARFVLSDVYAAPSLIEEQFDIVFTSYGVLKWLPDITRWAEVVARFLRPGGRFFVVEFHPFLYVFDYERAEQAEHGYFHGEEPIIYEEHGSYADVAAHGTQLACAWSHPVSDVVSALIRAGLTIDELKEYPYSSIDCFPFVERAGPENFVHRTKPRLFPLMYSIAAHKGEAR